MTTRRRRATGPAEVVPAEQTADEQATDEQATDEQAADEQAADEQATDEQAAVPAGMPLTTADTLDMVDQSFTAFWRQVTAYPPERMDEPVTKGTWTRKQMLAHVAGWHDMTTERLLGLAKNGERRALNQSDDATNARFARLAVGRTAGEVVQSVEASSRRLRRQIEMLTDEQLAAHGGWAARVIAANTYQHYAEHLPDLEPPADGPPASR